MAGDPRGSVWRRWDPHVHLPGTLRNDNFGTTSIQDALELLAERTPAIEVVGVTDYATTRSFRRAQAAWEAGAGSNLRLLFPNVELRLDIQNKSGSAVNLHLLCAPDQVDGLDQFLGGLEFTCNDQPYRADEEGLRAIGRAHTGNSKLDDEAALREGALQFKVNFEDLRKRFEANAWAKEHCLVVAAAGRNDGTSGVRSDDGGFGARRRQLERFCHALFTSNAQDRLFWLGQGTATPTELDRDYGGVKLCIHGSDAHEANRLGMPEGDRYTWLKGDPTFETLRLACLAPGTRAVIDATPPSAALAYGRIAEVTVTDASPWLTPNVIPLNPGLVAIIGSRGSGKTALADLIAVGADCGDPFSNTSSFVVRATPLLDNTRVDVEWTHGEATGHSLRAPFVPAGSGRGVRYLSQQFVETLCATDGISGPLLSEIERVVFNAWPPDDRQGATSFRELLALRLGPARARQRAELDRIAELGEAITAQRMLKRAAPDKQAERAAHVKALSDHEKQLEQLTAAGGATNSERLATVSAALAEREQQLQLHGRQAHAAEALRNAAAVARDTQFPAFVARLRQEHPDALLDDASWAAFLPTFSGDVNAVIEQAAATATAAYAAVAGTPSGSADASPLDALTAEELAIRTVSELRIERARLEQLVGLDQQRAEQLRKINEQVSLLRAAIAKLDQDLALADEADQRASDLDDERTAHYRAYFDALLIEEQQLRELYTPLGDILATFGPSVAKLRFSIGRTVDVDRWAAIGEELLDLRSGTFRGKGELARIAREELLDAWQSGDGEQAALAVKGFSQRHSASIREQANPKQAGPEGLRRWQQQISQWVYDASHITLSYTLEYDGLNIKRLSPGARGIVLLLLYLAVDQSETDPLIIDQPEENLDPESVYSELVDLFRRASERRQIIMVTHNANLVVNTDVDQVIVAHCEGLQEGELPTLQYMSGGLEQPAIRHAVCKVLEGGAEAFRQRARRLRIALPG